MKVIFDLDGTLALTEHREHFLRRPQSEKDWRGFYAACDMDPPAWTIVRTLKALMADAVEVEIWTGRSDEVADKTAAWLARHGLAGVPIRMRAAGDHRHDTDLKREWLRQSDPRPDLVFEDRARVVQMWRDEGVVCCQVAPGDF